MDAWNNVELSKREIYAISVGKNEDNLQNFPGQVKHLNFMKGDNEYHEYASQKGCQNEDINPSSVPTS